MNPDIFGIALIFGAIAIAGLTSARIAFFLGDRWKMGHGDRWAFTWFSGACAAIVMGYIAVAAQMAGGNLFGIVSLVASMPFVGLSWGVIVGANKANERIIFGLLKKLG